MKRFSLFILTCLLLAICSGAAIAAEPYLWISHVSVADLIENKATYEKAYFNQIELYAEVDRAQTEQDKSHVGSITIPNGSYYYNNADGNVIEVSNEDRTFDLTYYGGGDNYVEFSPSENGGRVWFRGGKAESSLLGKNFSWSLFGNTIEDAFPVFTTTQQQLASFVPYIERDSSRENITLRVINPGDTGKAVSLPSAGRYRIRFRNYNGNLLEWSGWQYFDSGDVIDKIYTMATDPDLTRQIIVDIQLYQDAGNLNKRFNYLWRFDVIDRSNQGVVDITPLTSPINMEGEEQIEIKIRYADGYRSSFINDQNGGNPILIGNNSVISVLWAYDEKTREITLTIKGLKEGETTLSLMYNNSALGKSFHTIPTRVVVSGKATGGDGGSSSGGCNAGLAGMLLLASISCVTIFSKPRKH